MNNLTSIDLGFGWVKSKGKHGLWRQPSVVGEARTIRTEEIRSKDVQYNDEYFIGDLALRQSKVKYSSVKMNRTEAWISEILFKTAIGIVNSSQQVTNLVTSLPYKYYFSQKDQMAELIERIKENPNVLLQIGQQDKVDYRTNIDQFKIVPQGFNAGMDYLLQSNGKLVDIEVAKKKILVIDVGYFTCNLVIIDGMEIAKESTTIEIGVNTSYDILEEYLFESIGKSPKGLEFDSCIKKGEYDGRDIQPLVDKAFQVLAKQIYVEVENLNMNFDIHLLVGGSANRLKQYFDIRNLIVPKDPQMAGVRGNEKIGIRAWG